MRSMISVQRLHTRPDRRLGRLLTCGTKVLLRRSRRCSDTSGNHTKAMKTKHVISKSLNESCSQMIAILCTIGTLSLGQASAVAQQAPATTAPATQEAPKISNAQLDSLVAPIALYSDELLAQTLAASTYPLEIIQLQQWMARNKGL